MFQRRQLVLSLMLLCLSLSAVLAQTPQAAWPEVNIILDSKLVRFLASAEVAEWRLEVLNPQGERIFDSGTVSSGALEWPLRNLQGEAVTSGLYGYVLTVKSNKDDAPRTRRGNIILNRAGNSSDQIWVTSAGEARIGGTGRATELAVTGSSEAPLGGARMADENERPALRRGGDGRPVDEESTNGGIDAQPKAPNAPSIAGTGTTNRLAKWLNGPSGLLGDSVLTELNGRIGIGPSSFVSLLSLYQDNTNYANIGGAGSHLVLSNPNAAGQNVLTSIINGSIVGKWRTDYAGNVSWVAGAGEHHFYTGGDYSIGSAKMVIQNAGNVGIGTTTPTARLEVAGNINNGLYSHSNIVGGFGLKGVATETVRPTCTSYPCPLPTSTLGAGVIGISNRGYGVSGESAAGIGVAGNSTSGTGLSGASTSGMGITGASTQGIGIRGTTSSTDSSFAGVYGYSNGRSATSWGPAGVLGESLYGDAIIGKANAVNGSGILGLSPNGYGVNGNGGSIGVSGYSRNGTGVSAGSVSGIGIFASNQGQTRFGAALRVANTNPNQGMAAYLTNTSNFATAHFANAGTGEVLYLQANNGPFIKAVSNAENEVRFMVNYDGTTVTRALQIVGGADLSEQFEVNEAPITEVQPEPGLVVSIDPERPGQLVVSSRAYDRRVAGIVSGAGGVKTGMMMGQTGSIADGRHAVALTGRVYVWADASKGAINPGDWLTTSETPGHAMRAANHAKSQGAILGKAMTGLRNGKGMVLVLVTLQ